MDPLIVDLTASDDATVIQSVERVADLLRRYDVAATQAEAFAGIIVALSTHYSPKVRHAVAKAAAYLPDTAFGDVISVLLRDRSGAVQRAARRSFDERGRRRLSLQVRDEQAVHIQRLFAKIDREHGREARRSAEYAAERSTELFVEKMHHELVRVATSLKTALVDVRGEAKRPKGDRARLRRRTEDAFAAFELLLRIVDSGREHTRVVAPIFKTENVGALVRDAVELVRGRLEPASLTRLAIGLAINEALVIEADRALLLQAFSNILQNSVEAYAETAPSVPIRIDIQALETGAQVVVSFADHGAGIPKDSLPHVGEPFASSKKGGRGLGVLNARKMVESVHGGSLNIVSERGVGTTVTIALPRRQVRS